MLKGFTSQFTNSVTPMPRTWPRTLCSAVKSTFISIGMIITQTSSPTGTLTRATSMRPMPWNTCGNDWPAAMPTTMHTPTQTLRYRSNGLIGAPVAGFTGTSDCVDTSNVPSRRYDPVRLSSLVDRPAIARGAAQERFRSDGEACGRHA